MPTIEKRVTSAGEVSWRVRVRMDGLRGKSCTFRNRDDAESWGMAVEREIVGTRLREVQRLANRWRPVPGYGAQYYVSDKGHIVSMRTGRLLSRTPHYKGYPQVHLTKGGEHQKVYIHHIVAEAFIGPRPAGKEINHIDRNKDNSCVENLEYVTPMENVQHWRDMEQMESK